MTGMVKHYLRVLSFILCVLVLQNELHAKKSKITRQGDPVIITGEWDTREGVKELYDTPLGKAYRFPQSCSPACASWFRSHMQTCNIKDRKCEYCRIIEENNGRLYQIQFNFFKSMKDAKDKDRRFVVLDFEMRYFPVEYKENNLEKLKSSSGRGFSIAFSSRLDGAQKISDFNWSDFTWSTGNINNQKEIDDDPILSKYKKFITIDIPEDLFRYHSDFQRSLYIDRSHSIRIVADTQEGTLCLWVYNEDGRNMAIVGKREMQLGSIPIKSISIISNMKNVVIEFSPPTVHLLESEDDFEKLPEIKPLRYPYGAYPMLSQGKKDRDDRKNLKNPDFIYANALRYLEGKDVECDMARGIDLLQDAVKDDHLFAMYQLGLCYYRGMGVEQSDKIARKYFNMADKIGHVPSKTMLDLMDYIVRYKTHYDHAEPLPGDMTTRKISNTPVNDSFKEKYKAGPLPGMIFNCSPVGWNEYGDYEANPKTAFYAAGTVYAVRRENQLSAADKARIGNMNSEVEALMKKYGFFIYYPLENKNAVMYYRAQCLDYSVESGFTPAMLYKGYIFSCAFFKWPWKGADFDADALALFERGAGLGNVDCYAHVLRMKLKKNQDISAEFKKNPFKLDVLDNPLYLLMKYCDENKDFPGRKLLIDYDLPEAEKFFKAKNDPNSKDLYSLINLELAFGVGKQLSDGMNLEHFTVGLKSLKESVDGGISDGLYLLGKYELYGKVTSSTPNEGIAHLQSAAKNGHLGAMWLLARKNWEKNKKYDETMKEIKPLLDIGIYPEVWAFAAEVAQRNTSGKAADAVALYEKAAKLGHAPSCNTLALAYYNGKLGLKKDTKKASEYWKMFLKFDTAQRNQDPMDIYYGEDKLPKLMMDACGLPVNPARNINDIPKEKKYFDTFIVTSGEANPVRQSK